jgi:hypothetical protein
MIKAWYMDCGHPATIGNPYIDRYNSLLFNGEMTLFYGEITEKVLTMTHMVVPPASHLLWQSIMILLHPMM